MFTRSAAYAPALQQAREERPIPIVGPSSAEERSKIGSQRSINWFPVKPERQGDAWFLRGRPGLELLTELPRRPIRGFHVHQNRLFVVAGARVYEVTSGGTTLEWGAISTSTGRVGMTSLGTVLVIGDGSGFYSLDIAGSGVPTPIAGAPQGYYCVTINQRVLFAKAFSGSGQVFYSELNDPTDVPALNFFTAESVPDTVWGMVATEDQLWLFGEDSTEVWQDVGGANNPFQRIPGGVIYSGVLYPETALRLDNSVWWVDRDKDGVGVVRRSNGFTPMRVSTSAVERFIKDAKVGGMSAYSYQEDGHTFYCLNALGMNTGGNQNLPTWCYDIKTGEWHERTWLNRQTGMQQRHRVEFHASVYGENIVGDYSTGEIYRQSLEYHSDAGQEIRSTRVTERAAFSGRNVIMDELWLDFASGVGLDGAGQGTDPQVMLRVSKDGGSFGTELTAPLGAIGQYDNQVRFFDLGVGRDWIFEISVSDPVLKAMMGGEVKLRVGRR